MRKIIRMVVVMTSIALLSGCATAWQSASYSDDMYSVHNKIAIANKQKAEAELAKAQYEAQQAQYEATLAKIKAEAAKQNVTVTEGTINGYDAVLADTYESAYARRLYAFSSPTYRMPSSYYTWRYSDAFFYASAYDPAIYNIVVAGDMVWVEPRYVTSMFGTWGAAVVVPSYSWYYGWRNPYYGWGNPYYRWHRPYYCGWNYPYYCNSYYYHHHYYHRHHHYHRPHYRPHRPSYHRPPYAGSGGVGSTGHHHNRPGMVVGRNPGASSPADRGGSYRTQPSSGRGSQPAYRGSSSSSSRNSGSSSYNSGSSSYRSSGSSSYRSSGSSSYRSSGSSSSSYRSSGGTSSSYRSGGSSSSGGYSGGGNSRGR